MTHKRAIFLAEEEYQSYLSDISNPVIVKIVLSSIQPQIDKKHLFVERLNAVKQAMLNNQPMHPLIAHWEYGCFALIDGHHRFFILEEMYGKDYRCLVTIPEQDCKYL